MYQQQLNLEAIHKTLVAVFEMILMLSEAMGKEVDTEVRKRMIRLQNEVDQNTRR